MRAHRKKQQFQSGDNLASNAQIKSALKQKTPRIVRTFWRLGCWSLIGELHQRRSRRTWSEADLENVMTGVGAALKLEHRRANSPPRHRSFRRRRVYVRAVGASRRFQRCRPSAFIPRENGKMIGGKLANISRVRPGEGPG